MPTCLRSTWPRPSRNWYAPDGTVTNAESNRDMPPPPEFATQYWAFLDRHAACPDAVVDVVARDPTTEEAAAGVALIISVRCPVCETEETFHLTGPERAYVVSGEMTRAAAAELQAAFKRGRRPAAPSRTVH